MVAISSFWDERKLLVLIALIILASATMLVEIGAARSGKQSFLDQFIGAVFTPLEGALTALANGASSGLSTLAHTGSYSAENSALKQKVQQLAASNERLKERAAENKELRKLLRMEQVLAAPTVAADVVGYVPEASRRELTINRGRRDGVDRDAVVVSGDGLVGHVIDAGPNSAHVLLVIDPGSAIPAFLMGTGSWGIVTGTWQHAKMKYIGQDVKVQAGDLVITGRGEVYPAGIPIGYVHEIDRKDNALYQTAVLNPVVDFGSLSHVLVLRSK